ncbi:MAG: hypothetical protein LBK52_02410, partial [Deltaproteobacteria bacterium]|nr:hypothetical protein [Deltaproteobacteria bacterium]
MEEILHLTCTGCGAAVDVVPGQKSLTCPYCGTVNALFEEEKEKGALEPALVIPAQVTKNAVHDFIQQTMIQDDMAPDDILEAGQIESETVAFYPCYVSKGSFSANWTASFGYDRQEAYTDYETQTINGRSRRVAVTRYRTVTDWRPASGVAKGAYLVSVYGGGDLAEGPASLLTRISKNSLTKMASGHVAGYEIHSHVLSADQAEKNLAPLISQVIKAEVMEHAQGDHQRNWHWDSTLRSEFLKPALAPLARGVFTYQSQTYNIWADGVDFSQIHTDPLPKDSRRSRAVTLGYLPLILGAAALIAGFFLLDNSYSWYPILAGLGLGIIFGVLRRSRIISFSKKMREASLARKKLEEAGSSANLSDEEREEIYKRTENP